MARKKFELSEEPSLMDVVGKKIVAIKGFRSDMRRKRGFSAIYVMFDDGETYLEFESQDYYTYHDCDPNAKIIRTFKNKMFWDLVMTDEKHYPDADIDPSWY
jgi:hypothetical protein